MIINLQFRADMALLTLTEGDGDLHCAINISLLTEGPWN